MKETTCGDFSAVQVEVGGRAFYTGECVFTFEKEDPLKEGFLVK